MALSEKLIQYAIKEFEVALRLMSATRASVHSFALSDNPRASIILSIVPTETIEKLETDGILISQDSALLDRINSAEN